METESERPKKLNQKRYWLSLAIIILLAVALAVSIYVKNKNSSDLPINVRKQVNFALYYPSPLPVGYSLEKDSVKVENNIVFYLLQAGDQKISVSEQAAPKIQPDFDALQKYNTSFKKVDTTAGRAIVGVDPTSQDPVAIIETNTTLITVSGAKNTPLDIISKLAQNLSSLPQ